MALQQINLRVEAGLLVSLKVLARERGLSLNAAAALAFEQFLQGQPQQKQAESSTDHEQRLLALEKRVAKLEAKPAPHVSVTDMRASPDQAKPAPPVEPAKIPQMGDGTITTADLAAATGTNRAAWNNWARDKNPGAIRKMKPEVGNWRYLGKAPSEMGGPERGLWEKA